MNQNIQDQEIDLSQISKKISGFIDSIGAAIFRFIRFIFKNIIVIGILFIAGAVMGYFIDKNNDAHVSQIIVTPNFGSVENLYAKVDLLQSRIAEDDTVFLKQIGLKNLKSIGNVAIEPVVDIYSFVSNNTAIATNAQNTQNFEVVKLLAEDGDINKVIKDKLTSKNYSQHLIKIASDGKTNATEISALLKFINNMPHYQNIRKTTVENILIKMKENQIFIDQINGLINQFSSNAANLQKSDKLVYYNENNQLNDIINTKNGFIGEIGRQKVDLISYQQVIKVQSSVLNKKNLKGTNGKMMLILPILFLFLFFGFSFLSFLYNNQKHKYA